MRTAVFISTLAATMFLQGCSALGGFEVRTTNMGSPVTTFLHNAADRAREQCTYGVAYERREARVDVRSPQYDPYTRPIYPGRQEVRTDTNQVVVCR